MQVEPDVWPRILAEVTDAEMEFGSIQSVMQAQRIIDHINRRIVSNKKMGPKVKEALQMYREALKTCIDMWALQNDYAMQSRQFMLTKGHPLLDEPPVEETQP